MKRISIAETEGREALFREAARVAKENHMSFARFVEMALRAYISWIEADRSKLR